MNRQKQTSTSAKILYRPFGLVASIASGLLASIIFKQIWKRVSPGGRADAPKPLESEYPLKEILVAATIQGALYALIKTSVDRGGARLFERATGEWPGD